MSASRTIYIALPCTVAAVALLVAPTRASADGLPYENDPPAGALEHQEGYNCYLTGDHGEKTICTGGEGDGNCHFCDTADPELQPVVFFSISLVAAVVVTSTGGSGSAIFLAWWGAGANGLNAGVSNWDYLTGAYEEPCDQCPSLTDDQGNSGRYYQGMVSHQDEVYKKEEYWINSVGFYCLGCNGGQQYFECGRDENAYATSDDTAADCADFVKAACKDEVWARERTDGGGRPSGSEMTDDGLCKSICQDTGAEMFYPVAPVGGEEDRWVQSTYEGEPVQVEHSGSVCVLDLATCTET